MGGRRRAAGGGGQWWWPSCSSRHSEISSGRILCCMLAPRRGPPMTAVLGQKGPKKASNSPEFETLWSKWQKLRSISTDSQARSKEGDLLPGWRTACSCAPFGNSGVGDCEEIDRWRRFSLAGACAPSSLPHSHHSRNDTHCAWTLILPSMPTQGFDGK